MAWRKMTEDKTKYNQVQNIIRRSHALILNLKMLGADTTKAKKSLDEAKTALEKGEYDSSIEYAKKSMVEVMNLKKNVKPDKKGVKDTSGSQQKAQIKTQQSDEEQKIDKKTESKTALASEDHDGSESEESDEGDGTKFEEGFSYLIEENRADMCFSTFSKVVGTDHKGLCICRINPAIIRKKYNFQDIVTMFWLTDRESTKESTIASSLESMVNVIEEFIDQNEETVILLDGLEYLISNNNFNPVLRFIRRLIDKISETSSILLISVSSKAVQEQELRLLEREMTPIFYN
jgi:hypothetical protein